LSDPGEITELLLSLEGNRERVADRLFPKVYDELRAVAGARLRAERAGHTLSPTALVHEAYLKLVNQDRVTWKNRAQFFAIAAQAMRRILIDYAEARNAEKRGGGAPFVTLGEASASVDSNVDELLTIDRAMRRLTELDARQARVVELRFFGGLTLEDIAAVEGDSLATINRAWRAARAFLTVELRDFRADPG
jgi:RNA polymerase sigma factor (TIGR02999 family)